MPVQRHYCDLDFGQLHYRSNSRSESSANNSQAGIPLLLLHQSPSDSSMYEALMAQLDDSYWMLAPDNPGFGASDSLPGGFSLAGCVQALLQWLASLEIEQCYVFGHHTGASIATELASAQPQMVKKIALCGPTLLTPQMQASLPKKAAAFPVAADGSHLLGMWQRMQGKEKAAPDDLLLREVSAAFAAGANYQQAYLAVTKQDFAGQLAQLDCPALVFAGTDDILYPQLQASFALLAQGTMAEVVGAGSYICDKQPQQVALLLQEFFGEA